MREQSSHEAPVLYVLRSRKDAKLYVGSPANIEKRFLSHNRGKVRSTKSRRPFDLIYTEEFDTVTLARKRERYLKTGQGRRWLRNKLLSSG